MIRISGLLARVVEHPTSVKLVIRGCFLTWCALAVLGCRTSQIAYAGGDGTSYEQAVVIKGAKDEEAGIAAENSWLKGRFGRFQKELQSLQNSAGKQYDVIKITTESGYSKIYFDITDFFGK